MKMMKTTSLSHVTTFPLPGVSTHKQLIPESAAHEGASSLDVLEVNHPTRNIGLDPARQGLGYGKILAFYYRAKNISNVGAGEILQPS